MRRYYRDLDSMTLEQFRHAILTTRLMPSEKILEDDLTERFRLLERAGVRTVEDLTVAVKTKRRLASFSAESGVPEEYLIVLRRRANSYRPKPIKLRDFPKVDDTAVAALADHGITDSLQLFSALYAADEPHSVFAFARDHGLPAAAAAELLTLSDFARAPYVGPTFARLLIDAGLASLDQVANMDAEALQDLLFATNEKTGDYRAPIPKDGEMESWLSMVRDLVSHTTG